MEKLCLMLLKVVVYFRKHTARIYTSSPEEYIIFNDADVT